LRYFRELAKETGAQSIIMVYEASGQGFGLADLLHQNGMECFVLSPTHLPKTPKAAKLKTDSRDAQMLLEQLRGHMLAGNALPVVWTVVRGFRAYQFRGFASQKNRGRVAGYWTFGGCGLSSMTGSMPRRRQRSIVAW